MHSGGAADVYPAIDYGGLRVPRHGSWRGMARPTAWITSGAVEYCTYMCGLLSQPEKMVDLSLIKALFSLKKIIKFFRFSVILIFLYMNGVLNIDKK